MTERGDSLKGLLQVGDPPGDEALRILSTCHSLNIYVHVMENSRKHGARQEKRLAGGDKNEKGMTVGRCLWSRLVSGIAR